MSLRPEIDLRSQPEPRLYPRCVGDAEVVALGNKRAVASPLSISTAPRKVVTKAFMNFTEQLTAWLARPSTPQSVNAIDDIGVVVATTIGGREDNQDKAAVVMLPTGMACSLLAIVADGIGGLQHGSEAAALTIAEFTARSTQLPEGFGVRDLLEVVNATNSRVYERFGGKSGATLSAVLFAKNFAFGLNVGDSSISQIRGNVVRKLTTDQNILAQLELHGIKPDVADPELLALTQYVGGKQRLNAEFLPMPIAELRLEGTKVLLSTDGVNGVRADVLSSLLNNASGPGEAARRILSVSRWLGGTDNATAIILDAPRLLSALGGEGTYPTDEFAMVSDPHGQLWAQIPRQLPKGVVHETGYDDSPPTLQRKGKRTAKQSGKKKRRPETEKPPIKVRIN